MRRFFTEPDNIKDGIIEIYEDSRHIEKVLRMNCGDRILVFDGTGTEYTAKLISIEKQLCRAEIESSEISPAEPRVHITLFQGLPKSGKMETIIQKAVELGVYEIVPVMMDRCVTRINDQKAGEEKAKRWNKVSVEAAKQCGRGKTPKVNTPITFDEAVCRMVEMDLAVMPYEKLGHEGDLGMKKLLESAGDVATVGIMVGPEGGFADSEADSAMAKGVKAVGLGKRILRTETVSGALIPVIMFYMDEF